MNDLLIDVRAEYDALIAFVSELSDEDWVRKTAFYDWTVADEIMHLHLVDLFGLTAINDAEAFGCLVRDVRGLQAKGVELSSQMRQRFGHFSPREQLAAWRATYATLCDAFAAKNGTARIPWFGPDMSVASFAIARQMEVWAHGQDIFDLFRVKRTNFDRIRNICDLGVRTQGWTFRNRGLDRPPPPAVSLVAPSGDVWTLTSNGQGNISGPAEDFALVVTQRRHVDDTNLMVAGAGARQWMEIAQCFAGEPATGPARGERAVAYA